MIGFVLLFYMITLIIWLAVFFRYSRSGNLLKGLVQAAICGGSCLLLILVGFILSGFLNSYQQEEGLPEEGGATLVILVLSIAIISPIFFSLEA